MNFKNLERHRTGKIQTAKKQIPLLKGNKTNYFNNLNSKIIADN